MADKRSKEIDDTEIPFAVQKVFEERHYRSIDRNARKSKPLLYRWAVICGAIILVLAYFCMPVSRVNAVRISGSTILDDEYIRSLADVSESSIYYLTVPFLVERRLISDPLIEDAEVSLEADNTVRIQVTEKKILGYRYDEEPLLVMTDGTQTALKSEFLSVISKVPMIIGFNEPEQIEKLAKSFADVDQKIIRDISEISQYSLSYDPESIRVLMRSGGYFMGNYYNISMLNQYWNIYNHQKDKSQCIFADDSMQSAFSKVCPWDEPDIEREYWTDEDGKIITNTYGDKVEKHYYLGYDGTPALDSQGRKIPIPISRQGFEVPDPQFHEHYEKGFYADGTLKIPEDYDENAETEPAESAEPSEEGTEPAEEGAEQAAEGEEPAEYYEESGEWSSEEGEDYTDGEW